MMRREVKVRLAKEKKTWERPPVMMMLSSSFTARRATSCMVRLGMSNVPLPVPCQAPLPQVRRWVSVATMVISPGASSVRMPEKMGRTSSEAAAMPVSRTRRRNSFTGMEPWISPSAWGSRGNSSAGRQGRA